jgi:hypothetical protein
LFLLNYLDTSAVGPDLKLVRRRGRNVSAAQIKTSRLRLLCADVADGGFPTPLTPTIINTYGLIVHRSFFVHAPASNGEGSQQLILHRSF